MGEGVVADDMTSPGDFANNVRTLLSAASDEKKGCGHVVLRQSFQQSLGVRIIRAVVIGEGELLRAAREAGESAPIPLSGGSHRLISSGDGSGGRCGSSEQRSKHGGILDH